MNALLCYVSSSSSSSSDDDNDNEDTINNSTTSKPLYIRNFPHVVGQWPSHVFLTVPTMHFNPSDLINDYQSLVHEVIHVWEASDCHVSLSRPFVLQYHDIDPFVQALRHCLRWQTQFDISWGSKQVLINDAQTRSFVAMNVEKGHADVCSVIERVNHVLTRFHQCVYYENPIPHMTIASALGPSLYQEAQQGGQRPVSLPRTVSMKEVVVKIGNKVFTIPLF